MGRPFTWDDHVWSAKRPGSLLQQIDPGVEFELIEEQSLSDDQPKREANHQRAKWQSACRLDHFHAPT